MTRPTRVRLCRAAAAVLIGGLAGCSLIPVAALGTAGAVADIAGFSFSTGTEVFSLGKLESVELATYGKTDNAVRATFNDLRLRVRAVSVGKDVAHYEAIDDAGWDIKVDLQRHTALIVRVQIDVGLFGSEAMARLMLKAIRVQMARSATQPSTEPSVPVRLGGPEDADAPTQILGPAMP